ncbi:hypothetical protein [Planktothricoides raciborskii]|uniref:Uncharacterized protein n=1 Tax=Planktothricoides raciborskii FACHB-1370 TaxID=2949576 RepID=A0ABR8EAE7_9CYAN|nr:hypothetical protein [Planktothricoides raciborskii]MBD2542567.1 hypothetical protein [Planktothricoides raciborskii FACHB-1370]MBD2581025.1 hypothetical protein [Planktothricoides raciborskii FACHB-1261]
MIIQKPGFFSHFTVKFNLHHRNPVSFFGGKKAIAGNLETGFLFGIPQLNFIYTTETRFLFLGARKRSPILSK